MAEQRHELNLDAGTLDRPIEDVTATLLHEMVHLYHLQTGVQDWQPQAALTTTKNSRPPPRRATFASSTTRASAGQSLSDRSAD